MKIGLIGLGTWGKIMLPKLDQQCEVVYCSNNSNVSTKKWLTRNFSVIRHTFDYTEVLNDSEIEAVVITTPIETHNLIVNESLRAGKHVFVEKPLATKLSDVRNLITQARQAKLNLFVGYIYINHEIMNLLKKINISDPFVSVDMQWCKYGSFTEDIYWNLLSHELSILHNFFGSGLKKIQSTKSSGDIGSINEIQVPLLFDHNVNCTININRLSNSKVKNINFVTRSGDSYLWQDEVLYKKDTSNVEICRNIADKLETEIDLFFKGVKSGKFEYKEDMHKFICDIISQIKKRTF